MISSASAVSIINQFRVHVSKRCTFLTMNITPEAEPVRVTYEVEETGVLQQAHPFW